MGRRPDRRDHAALQFGLVVGSMEAAGSSWGAALWRFIGFFTIIMKMSATLVMTHAALRPNVRTGLSDPRAEFAVATAMGIVAIVYSAALHSIWNPQGWQLVADHGLHDVMPALFLLFWFLRPHGPLRTPDTLWALVLPVAYCFYAMIRGAFDGWYAYHFLDAAALDAGTLARNIRRSIYPRRTRMPSSRLLDYPALLADQATRQ